MHIVQTYHWIRFYNGESIFVWKKIEKVRFDVRSAKSEKFTISGWGCLFWRFHVVLTIFQWYRDLEQGDTSSQSLKSEVPRPRFEPQTPYKTTRVRKNDWPQQVEHKFQFVFHSRVMIFHLRLYMAFWLRSSYDIPGLAPLMNVLF